jgi:hypothetical protein
LTSNITKIRQCAQTYFPLAQNLLQSAITNTTSCTTNTSANVQNILVGVNSSIYGVAQDFTGQIGAVTACLSKPILSRLSCLQTAVGSVMNASSIFQPYLTTMANAVQANLGNLTQSFMTCANMTVTSARSAANTLASNVTKCITA